MSAADAQFADHAACPYFEAARCEQIDYNARKRHAEELAAIWITTGSRIFVEWLDGRLGPRDIASLFAARFDTDPLRREFAEYLIDARYV